MTELIVAFLIVHGLLHLVIWLPHPQAEPVEPPPFDPGHSAVLAVVAPDRATHRLSVVLAVAATAAYLVAGVALATGSAAVIEMAVLAASLGLLLKVLFFHPWLTVGVLLDVGVLVVALAA